MFSSITRLTMIFAVSALSFSTQASDQQRLNVTSESSAPATSSQTPATTQAQIDQINAALANALASLQIPGSSSATISFSKLSVGQLDGVNRVLDFSGKIEVNVVVLPPPELQGKVSPETYTLGINVDYFARNNSKGELVASGNAGIEISGNMGLLLGGDIFAPDVRVKLSEYIVDFLRSISGVVEDAGPEDALQIFERFLEDH